MTYAVDFRGWCEIEANSAEEARDKFWKLISEDKPLPNNCYKLDSIEERED